MRSLLHRDRFRVFLILPLAALGALLSLKLPGAAAAAPARGFVPVRISNDARLSPELRDEVLAAVREENAAPQHIVVLIHGWDTPPYESARQYEIVARHAHAAYETLGESVVVVGLQWASDAGALRSWAPRACFFYLVTAAGFRNALRDPYQTRIPTARATGRQALRELLFALRGQFPKTRLHLFAHSMGAEVAAHALDPDFTPKKQRKELPAFRPDDALAVDVVALAGADLDHDASKNRPPSPEESEHRPRLLWITLPKVGSRRDKVLMLRKSARNKKALGDSVPQFRGDQLDTLVAQRKLVYDSIDIPTNHALVRYFSRGRLDRLAAASVQLRNPGSNVSPLLTRMSEVLKAPNTVEAISPYLLGDETTPKVYALWRLERLMDGNAAHIHKGYSERVLMSTLKDVRWWDAERKRTECKVVRAGLWPPSDVVARVRAAQEQREKARAAE